MQKDTIGKSKAEVLIGEKEVIKIEATSLLSNNEYEMMKFLKNKINVPEVLDFHLKDGFNYLKMSKLSGKMLCDEELMKDPYKVICLAARSLKMLWNVRVAKGEFTLNLDKKLEIAIDRVEKNKVKVNENNIYEINSGKLKTVKDAIEWLKNNRPKVEKLVLSHGDLCLPNIFINGNEISFIDLGLCGVDDAYQDIAILYRSLKDNFFGKYATNKKTVDLNLFFSELGITPDYKKIEYYLLLDELF